jgi:hypothetical protein
LFVLFYSWLRNLLCIWYRVFVSQDEKNYERQEEQAEREVRDGHRNRNHSQSQSQMG